MTYSPGSDSSPKPHSDHPMRRLSVPAARRDIRKSHVQAGAALVSRINKERAATVEPGPEQRQYAVSVLFDDGTVRAFEHDAPENLFLEDICARFARGALIATGNGQIAVEDLRPGDMIKTRDNGFQTLRWISRCMIAGQTEDAGTDTLPIRIKADALGELRPLQDLVVSHRFRMLTNHPSCIPLFGSPEALAPAIDLLDGESVLQFRPSCDLMFFNLMFDGHQIIEANGLETESYHPGNYGVSIMPFQMQAHLRQIFPHLNGNLENFGKVARPMLRGFEAKVLRAG